MGSQPPVDDRTDIQKWRDKAMLVLNELPASALLECSVQDFYVANGVLHHLQSRFEEASALRLTPLNRPHKAGV